jgi:hypothetical protein
VHSSTTEEFAGNASPHDPSHIHSPLQLDAHFDWNADTGATSHMTPHRHWLHNYQPLRIPIKLADDTVVYSAGVGSVVFSPVIGGKEGRSIELSCVLHVPVLRTNLLSVLFISRLKGFIVRISANSMGFSLNGTTLFTATINEQNAAFLKGTTIAVSEFAKLSSTLPMDLSLSHRRLAHHNYDDVKKLINQDLVTGLTIDTKTAPDPICELLSRQNACQSISPIYQSLHQAS